MAVLLVLFRLFMPANVAEEDVVGNWANECKGVKLTRTIEEKWEGKVTERITKVAIDS